MSECVVLDIHVHVTGSEKRDHFALNIDFAFAVCNQSTSNAASSSHNVFFGV